MIEILMRQSMWEIALISGIPLAACAAAGLMVAILQAATQVQEQSVAYAVKFLAVSAVFLIGGTWFAADLLRFVQESLAGIQQVRP